MTEEEGEEPVAEEEGEDDADFVSAEEEEKEEQIELMRVSEASVLFAGVSTACHTDMSAPNHVCHM